MILSFLFSFLDCFEIYLFFKYLDPFKSRNIYLTATVVLTLSLFNFLFSNFSLLYGVKIEVILFIIDFFLLIICFKSINSNDVIILFFLNVISTIEAVGFFMLDEYIHLFSLNNILFPVIIHLTRIGTFFLFANIVKSYKVLYGNHSLKGLLMIMIPINIFLLILFEGIFIFDYNPYYNLILLVSIIVGISIFLITKKQYIIESENEKLRMVNKILGYSNEQHQILEEKAKEVRKIKHDLVNNLSVIQCLFSENKNEEGLQYLEKLIGNANKTAQTTIIKYPYLNALFNFKKYKFDDIKFVCEIGEVELSKVMEFDCCTILSNLLDNAIEEINRCSSNDRTIKLKLKDQCDTIIITVSNAYHQQKSLNTEKQNRNEHGMGLTIVNTIVKKYNGELIIEQDKLFKVQLFLKK